MKKESKGEVSKLGFEVKELWEDRRQMGKLLLGNIPNFLTIARVFLTFVVIYLILTRADVIGIVVIFAIAALTDWFDGRLARKFDWESEFGRKADMIADRFLWVGTALAFIVSFGTEGLLSGIIGIQLLLIMTREIFTAPFVLIAFFSGSLLPYARYVAKVTTFIQGFALPALILSTIYPYWIYVSFPLAILCFITGLISSLFYLKDIHAPSKNIGRKK